MKTALGNLDKIMALITCLVIAFSLAYFLFGKNTYIALAISGVIGVFAAVEIRKSKPGNIVEKSGDIAGTVVIETGKVVTETVSDGFFTLVFRGLIAVVTRIVSAIIP